MKSIVSTGPRTSELREFPMPVIRDDHILIRLKYVGVCMSGHSGWAHAKPGDAFGHEPLGIVEQVGANVTGCKPGDRAQAELETKYGHHMKAIIDMIAEIEQEQKR